MVNTGKNYLFSPQEVTHFFMEYGKLVTYHKGNSLFSPGEMGDKIYYVNHGEVKVSRATNEGKEIILALLGPGDIFGEAEAIGGQEWKNSAFAKKDTILHQISRETLLDRMQKDPKTALWVSTRLANQQLKTENLLEGLLFKSASAKVAHVLLELAENHGVISTEGTLIDYMITHQEIGNSIATTRETVSYAFMEFRQLGLIGTKKRRTVILDRPALERMAEV